MEIILNKKMLIILKISIEDNKVVELNIFSDSLINNDIVSLNEFWHLYKWKSSVVYVVNPLFWEVCCVESVNNAFVFSIKLLSFIIRIILSYNCFTDFFLLIYVVYSFILCKLELKLNCSFRVNIVNENLIYSDAEEDDY